VVIPVTVEPIVCFSQKQSILMGWELCTAGYDSVGSSCISHTNWDVS